MMPALLMMPGLQKLIQGNQMNPADVKLRVPFQFVPPVEVVQPAAAPKPKPKAAPKQLSMAAFLKEN